MRIITISRQFGSGGRELGKRLAGKLGWDYYDKQIIETLADDHKLDAEYVKKLLSSHGWQNMQLTYKNSFSHLMFNPGIRTELLVREREILHEIARVGNDCVIVGRDADVILQEEKPFRIFVCADINARLARCMKRENERERDLRLSEQEILRNIRRIDRNRNRTREVLTGKRRGDGSAFDLTVNTTNWAIPALCEALSDFSLRYFEG